MLQYCTMSKGTHQSTASGVKVETPRQQEGVTSRGRGEEGISQSDDEGVSESTQDADLTQHPSGQLRAAQDVRNPLQSYLLHDLVNNANALFLST